jgi:hypothetical protein
MKLNRIITLCAMAATLALSATTLLAQDNNNGDQGGPGGPGGQQGQQGRRNRQGGPGGGFDPAQMQVRMLERIQEDFGFTNDTEWEAVKPLFQKVMEARQEAMASQMGGMGRMFRPRNNDQGNNRPRGGMFGQPSPEQEALQKAIDDNAPSAQIKDLLTKYQTSVKAKQAKFEAAQTDLRKVLSTKQEAQATLMGLLN